MPTKSATDPNNRVEETDNDYLDMKQGLQPQQTVLTWHATFNEVIAASIPTVLSNIFLFLIQICNIYFMGRQIDQNLMAAVGMGNMLINVICFAVCQGFNGTIETFVSQSFGGGDGYMCGV